LGCKKLSESIKEEVKILGTIRETSNSQDLQGKLRERAHWFYYDYPKNLIKKGVTWFEKLKVKETDQIEIKYLLKTEDKVKTKYETACILKDEEKIFTLYVTSKLDYSDISRHVVKYIYKSHKLKDILNLFTLLESSRERLELILKQKLQHDKKLNQKSINQENDEHSPLIKDNSLNPQLEKFVLPLQKMFSDCDPDYIRQCLKQEKQEKGDRLFINVKEKLMEGNYQKINPIPDENHFPDDISVSKPLPITPIDITRNIREALQNSIKTFRPKSESFNEIVSECESQSSYCEVIPGMVIFFYDLRIIMFWYLHNWVYLLLSSSFVAICEIFRWNKILCSKRCR